MQSGNPLAATLNRLEKWLMEHRSRYHRALLPGASAADIQKLESGLGFKVPGDLRTLLAWHNGQSPEAVGSFEQAWLIMSSSEIMAAKRELDANSASTGWQAAWVPFLSNDAGDYLCIDASQPGPPVREFWQDQDDHGVIARSLAAWMEEFVSAVEKGQYTEDPERGSFLRL